MKRVVCDGLKLGTSWISRYARCRRGKGGITNFVAESRRVKCIAPFTRQ